ncbi:MAG: flavodoxin domain-containing protein [Acidimicrobiales bacterium]|jgi:menaquinone-dependent protoporphyrinogen oxidase
MNVLVAYGSKRGGTAGLAEMISGELTAAGLQAVVRPAREVKSLEGFDVVVVAGALYAFRWHRDARRFVRRHAGELRERPVWLVSSGPLDDSASTKEVPPVKQVAAAMSAIGARGHVTFGGRLEPDAKGFPASAMAKKKAGDWRDPAQVHRWASEVAGELAHLGDVA